MESFYPPTSSLQTTRNQDTTTLGEDGLLVLQPPKCAVYPELPADYYCVDCHCFVSSHGHVRGAHRNHHFLTIREAAELHLPAMKAWTARCEVQLHKAEGILRHLSVASRALDAALSEEERNIETAFERIVEALVARKESLKRQLRAKVAMEQSSATQAWRRMDDVVSYFSSYLEHCAALLVNVPPVEAMDTATVLWSADVMHTAELLGSAAQVDDVWLPELVVPKLRSPLTPDTVNELLHLDLLPAPFSSESGLLPATFDVRPFQLHPVAGGGTRRPPESGSTAQQGGPPQPSSTTNDSRPHEVQHQRPLPDGTPQPRTPYEANRGRRLDFSPQQGTRHSRSHSIVAPSPEFTLRLVAPTDPHEHETVLLFNDDASLTRNTVEGASPTEHLLIRGSPKFSAPGLYGWQVHVDRLGEPLPASEPTSRLLAGIAEDVSAGGAGVVWNGLRIIGPSDEQVYVIPNKQWEPKAGTTLRFVLELDENEESAEEKAACAMLHCFFEEEYVTTVFLPTTSSTSSDGRCVWCPAFSVRSPEEQITGHSLPPARSLALAMLATPPPPTAADGQAKRRRYASGWHTNTPQRHPPPKVNRSDDREGYSPELKELLDQAERMRRNDKQVAWL